MIFIERFILGGVFFLLFLFGILLLLVKDDFIRSPKMHRYLGASVLFSAFSLLYMYLELVCPDGNFFEIAKIILGLGAILVYFFIGYKIISLLINKYMGASAAQPKAQPAKEEAPAVEETPELVAEEPEKTVTEEVEEPADAEEENTEEAAEEEEEDTTDEHGEAIPEPSVNNMEDLIFFQKLEALMARKKLFSEQEITREQIATEIGTNRTYLIRSIKLATGMTFNEYITSLRVNYAATLLITSDEPLEYIGTIAGFRSKSAYYRAFTAANNCTPSEFRARNRAL